MTTIGIPPSILKQITALFEKYPAIEEAIVFGSRAKGNFREGSDFDIVLNGKSLDSNLLTKLQMDYEALYLPWKLDIILYDTIENVQLKAHIDQIGKKIYQKYHG